jgi:phosphopantothenate-cysteine ligase
MAVWMSDEEMEQGKEIEAKIVTELIKMHQRFVSGSAIQGTSTGPAF